MSAAPNGVPASAAVSAWSVRRFVVGGAVLAVLLTSGVGLWAKHSMIAGAVIAQGHLRVDSKRKEIAHLEGGVVAEIRVRDGDQVEAGDVLLRLDRTSAAASLEIVDGQLDELMALRARLEAEQFDYDTVEMDDDLRRRSLERPQTAAQINGQRAIFDAARTRTERQLSQFREQIAQIEQQIVGYHAQLGAIELQLGLVADELSDRKDLFESGISPKTAMTELQRKHAELEGDKGAITSQSAEAAARISEITLRSLEVEAERRQQAVIELREVDGRINELREQRISLAQQVSRTDIVAPQSGTVLNMDVATVGGVVAPGSALLSIVPLGEKLVVETRIDAASRDQVWVGQSTRVKFPGFNQRTTPELAGAVKTVAADVLTDERTGLQYFTAEIAVSENEFARLDEAAPLGLTPGMPVEVYIQTAERSAGSYIAKPITDSLGRAFREE